MPQKKARIIGLGSYLPERILTNQDLEKLVDTSDEWIVSRTGISERRIAAADEFPSDMGAAAAKSALQKANLDVTNIELIIVATMTSDYISPSTAAIVQSKLGAVNAATVDIQAACTGFLYGISMAKAYVESGLYSQVLVVATEKMSSIMDYTDRNTCVLFGDGAAAAVVSNKGSGFLIDTVCLGSDGNLAELLYLPAGGSKHSASQETITQKMHYLKMEGREIFKHAVKRMISATKECLEKAGIKEEQLSWVVPHQANIRIMDALAKGFDIPGDRIYKTIHKYGNTSASAVAIALDELVEGQAMAAGEHLLLVAFGGGLTWGAAILTKMTERKDG